MTQRNDEMFMVGPSVGRTWKSPSSSAGEVHWSFGVDTFLARQVRNILDIIYPGVRLAAARMIYSGAGNTQNKDGPTEHKPNYRRAACHCPLPP